MEMSHFKPEHVAQQSRRHKLRFQQCSTQPHPFQDISSNLEHVQFQPGLDAQVYNSNSIPSQMLNFSDPIGSKNVVSHLSSSSFNVDSTSGGNVEKSGVWRSVGSNQSCSQMINFGSGLAANRSDTATVVDLHGSADDLAKFMNNRHQEMNPDSSQLNYQNSYRDHVVTTAFIGQQAGNYLRGNVPNSKWSSQCGNELALLPTYREDSTVLNQNNAASWICRVVEEDNQWNSELGFLPNKTECGLRSAGNESSSQGLVLSLCSNPSSVLHGSRFGDRSIPEALSSRAFEASEESKPPGPLKPVSRSSGGSLQDVVVGTSNNCNRQMGPLGPFTGYATILKSSKFLRPAQQLLDEFCGIVGSKLFKVSESWEKNPGEACALADAVVKFSDTEVQSKSSTSDVPFPTFQRSDNQLGKLVGAAESSSCDSHSPENQHRKAKLLYMQEEVSRRYKQYRQQMQMVVASFESVAGLTGATPYISLALRTVSKHFKHLKNGISEQLRNIRTTLGEDLSSHTAGTSNTKTHGSGSKMKMVDPKFSDSGLHAPQQHIWRPQRGLPERAVSVLRAWLFEHFLHPYPTDTDKHMLATQTGLTRNQVSNWFINARVRLWKPMVEEIHMLETNGVTERDVNLVKEGKSSSTIQGTSQLNSDNSSSELGTSDQTIKQFECSTIAPSLDTELFKRSRVEGPITPIMDGGVMDFVPYYRSGLEMAGHGSISLTLGLRQSADYRHVVEGARYHHEQLQQEDHIRSHFGSHIHEFVG